MLNCIRVSAVKQGRECVTMKYFIHVHGSSLTNFDLSIDADPNRNYDVLEHSITSAINKHLPTKTIKFNKHKHKNSNWITQGIIKSIKYRDMLYRKLKKTNPYCQQHEVMVINLHTYNNILKRSIRKSESRLLLFSF